MASFGTGAVMERRVLGLLLMVSMAVVVVLLLSMSADDSEAVDYHPYMVNFNPDEVDVYYSGSLVEPMASISEGHTIGIVVKTGYCNPSINGESYTAPRTVTAAMRDTGVVVEVEKKQYSISFGKDGGEGTTIPTIETTIGQNITIDEQSYTKQWYHSTKWIRTVVEEEIEVDPGVYAVNSSFIQSFFGDNTSIILHPKWILNEYTIMFNSNSGIGNNPSQIVIKLGDSPIMPQIPYSKTGYTASNWSINSDGSGFSLVPGQTEVTSSTLSSLNLGTSNTATLYPHWIAKNYRINYDANGGEGTPPDSSNTTIGGIFSIPEIKFEKLCNTAVSWSTRADDTGKAISPGNLTLNENTITEYFGDGTEITLYANWVKNQYSIQLVVNGKTTECTVTIDEGLQDPDCEPGFRFVGWFYKNDQGNETRFNDMSQMYDGMTLYAAFEPIKDSPIEMALCAAILIAAFAVVMFVAFRKQV